LAGSGARWFRTPFIQTYITIERNPNDFQAHLGLTRHVLADRLGKLVGEGILVRVRYQERPARFEYRLTEKGLDLYPVIVSLLAWGDRWKAGAAGPPILLQHRGCGTVAVPVPPPPPPCSARELAHQRQAQRRALHQQIWGLHQQGWPGWAIAQQLGIGKNTVYRYLRTETLPERQRRADRGRSILTPYHAYLLERWNAGHRDALRLFRELQQRGYAGSYPTVARYAQRLRQAQGQTPRQRKLRQTLPVVAEPASRHLTARRATWLVLRRPERLNDDEAAPLAQLQAQQPELAGAIALAQDFTRLVRERQPDQLEPWLARAAESPHVPLQRFAKGLRDDYDAVTAGVTLPWSNGPVEGQINRLKLLKRQMFGRANLDLLQQRFLLAA